MVGLRERAEVPSPSPAFRPTPSTASDAKNANEKSKKYGFADARAGRTTRLAIALHVDVLAIRRLPYRLAGLSLAVAAFAGAAACRDRDARGTARLAERPLRERRRMGSLASAR